MYTLTVSRLRGIHNKRYSIKVRSVDEALNRAQRLLDNYNGPSLRTAWVIYIYKRAPIYRGSKVMDDKKIFGVLMHANYGKYS